jgi:hypothetical protein
MRTLLFGIWAGLSLSACASMAQQDVPAVIVTPTPESHAELVQVVSSALNSADVRIAPDALTREDLLAIDHTPARDASGQRLSGRDYGRPEHFRLVKDGSQCVLIHTGTGVRHELKKVDCAAK